MRVPAPHVAYVCADRGVPVLGTKGASIHIRELVNALVRRGAVVRILAARPGDGPPRARVRARIIDVGSAAFLGMLRDRVRQCAAGRAGEVLGNEAIALLLNQETYLSLQRLHARWRIDAIYERYSLWGHAGLRFAQDHGIPFLLEVNAPLRLEQARYRALGNTVVAEALEGQLFRLADLVVVPSNALREYVLDRGGRRGRVRVVCNAADPDFLRPAVQARHETRPQSEFVLGFVGSLKPWHGIDDLLRAFVHLWRRDPSYRLLVVGDGPLRPAVEKVRRRRGLKNAIRITGSVEYADMPVLLRQMDVGLAPYPRLPAFYFSPIKIYEYMAAGVPIVASAVGQIAEVLTHRTSALLHPPGSVRMMVGHVEELRRRPALGRRVAREARRLMVRRFTWERNAARVLAMIQTLRSRRGTSRNGRGTKPTL